MNLVSRIPKSLHYMNSVRAQKAANNLLNGYHS